MIHILFVDDEPQILDGLKRSFRPMRNDWEMSFATSGEEALMLLDGAAFDVIVTDMRMPGMDGAALLEIVREKHPSLLRLILSGYSDLQASLRAASVAHQFLVKPCDREMLRSAISRVNLLNGTLESKMLTSLVGSLRTLPSVPHVLVELNETMAQPNASIDAIAKIVQQDVAVSAKLLQLVNSAFFGIGSGITDVKTAVNCLGMNVLHDLVVGLKIFHAFGANEYVSPEYYEGFYQHAQLCARIASGIAQEQRLPSDGAVAALLHDVGKLIIAERIPAHFARVLEESQNESVPFFEVEENLIRFSHAEVGAYLLSLWGIPETIVEAVAHHHHPRRVPVRGFSTILLVHVADCLAHECEPGESATAMPALDMSLLEEAHVADRLEKWREIARVASKPPYLALA